MSRREEFEDEAAKHVSGIVSEYKPGQYYLRNLAVSEHHRGKGIGTRYMQNLIGKLPSGASLTVHTRKDLMPWYSKLGFEHEGEDVIGHRMTRHLR